MKFSKLLQFLLCGIGAMQMGVVDAGGGGSDDEAAKAAKASADAAAAAAVKAAEEAAAAAAAKKTDDPNKPTDQEAKLIKEVMQKKELLQKTQADFEAFKKQFEGIDPVAVKAMLDAQKEAETRALEAKGEWDRLKARMADEHGKQTKTLQDQIDALRGELGAKDGAINELSVGSSFAQSTFIANELTLTPSKARVVYAGHFDLVDGKVVGYDKPKGVANRTALVDGSGNSVAFDEALRKIVDADPDKDALLKSKVKPGADSHSKSSVGTKSQQQQGEQSSLSKIQAGLASLKVANNKNGLS